MQANLVEREGVRATVKVTVPSADVDRTFDGVLRQLARQVKVPGFRPGRAPEGVLIKRIGAENLAQEVRDALVDEHYPKAVRQLELTPVHAHFHSDAPTKGAPFEFEVHLDLYPDFALPDLDEIVIDTDVPPVTDEMVAQTVERLQRENATLVPVDRPSQPGDTVMIETVTEAEAEAAEPASQMPVDLEAVDEALAEQLLNRSIGDEVVLELGPAEEDESSAAGTEEDEATTAADGDDAAAARAEREPSEGDDQDAGARARQPRTLRVRITNVQQKDKPEADDELAATLGFDSWSATVERIRASIREQLESEAFEEQREELVEKLMAETSFDLPPSLVNRRKVNLLENLAEDLRRRGMTLEQYFADLEEKGTREEFEAELTEAAERGVKRDLILERLLDDRGTEVSDAEFQQALRHLAAREGMDVQRFRRERDDSWLANYRFLLARDKALREVLSERVGAAQGGESGGTAAAQTPVGVRSADGDEEIVEAGSAPPPTTAGDDEHA